MRKQGQERSKCEKSSTASGEALAREGIKYKISKASKKRVVMLNYSSWSIEAMEDADKNEGQKEIGKCNETRSRAIEEHFHSSNVPQHVA